MSSWMLQQVLVKSLIFQMIPYVVDSLTNYLLRNSVIIVASPSSPWWWSKSIRLKAKGVCTCYLSENISIDDIVTESYPLSDALLTRRLPKLNILEKTFTRPKLKECLYWSSHWWGSLYIIHFGPSKQSRIIFKSVDEPVDMVVKVHSLLQWSFIG